MASHTGRSPRPDQTSARFAGLRYFGGTFLPERGETDRFFVTFDFCDVARVRPNNSSKVYPSACASLRNFALTSAIGLRFFKAWILFVTCEINVSSCFGVNDCKSTLVQVRPLARKLRVKTLAGQPSMSALSWPSRLAWWVRSD